ncbi:Neuronal acetylcholine receptor subunit alpha-3 [Microtus ochrogaster]|uniref:Neuronal acetylcholine receptor subunit alpha-3 n=1 Tax=Microtus ochrogaster TaxID=79684 RepID=A0A8J6GG61_MICOH|nr:Neuronal acetylcholine receptor subunit alpha-3 [Microtus ochrogaster]
MKQGTAVRRTGWLAALPPLMPLSAPELGYPKPGGAPLSPRPHSWASAVSTRVDPALSARSPDMDAVPLWSPLSLLILLLLSVASASEAEHRLFQYLFEDYNEIIRPVANVSHPVVIQFEVSMSQLVKVDEVNQIMETNLWLKQIWNDYKLKWKPSDYQGVEFIRVPAEKIWKPDIVLYNK